jgi:hypothetical protein
VWTRHTDKKGPGESGTRGFVTASRGEAGSRQHHPGIVVTQGKRTLQPARLSKFGSAAPGSWNCNDNAVFMAAPPSEPPQPPGPGIQVTYPSVLNVQIGRNHALAGGDTEVNAQNVLLATNACVACDLSGLDLNGIDLPGVSLYAASLKGAHFAGSRFNGASIAGTDFSAADLPSSELNGTVFFTSNYISLPSADSVILTGANLSNAIIRNIIDAHEGLAMTNAALGGADLAGTTLSNFNLTDSTGTPINAEQAI